MKVISKNFLRKEFDKETEFYHIECNCSEYADWLEEKIIKLMEEGNKQAEPMNGEDWCFKNKGYLAADGETYLPESAPRAMWFYWMDEFAKYKNKELSAENNELKQTMKNIKEVADTAIDLLQTNSARQLKIEQLQDKIKQLNK